MKVKKSIRHGDMALAPVDSMPEGLKKSKSNVLMTGSHNNDHIVKNGEFYPHQENNFVVGYLKAGKDTTLQHVEHGEKMKGKMRTAPVEAGIYEVRKQHEMTHQGMEPVID